MIAGTLTTRAAWMSTAAVVAIAGCSLGCDRPATSAPSAATAPTPATPAPTPTPTVTLSGVVARRSPSGQIPIDYVQVKITNALREATTDAHGRYSISGLPAADTSLLFVKWGYDSLTSTVKMSGDTTLDVSLNRQPTFVLWGSCRRRHQRAMSLCRMSRSTATPAAKTATRSRTPTPAGSTAFPRCTPILFSTFSCGRTATQTRRERRRRHSPC